MDSPRDETTDPFRAIADPSRRKMLDAMRERERSVGELTAMLGVRQPTVTGHLNVLRRARLCTVRAQGRHRYYAAAPERLAEIEVWLAPYRAFWTERMSRLGVVLAREARHAEDGPEDVGPDGEGGM